MLFCRGVIKASRGCCQLVLASHADVLTSHANALTSHATPPCAAELPASWPSCCKLVWAPGAPGFSANPPHQSQHAFQLHRVAKNAGAVLHRDVCHGCQRTRPHRGLPVPAVRLGTGWLFGAPWWCLLHPHSCTPVPAFPASGFRCVCSVRPPPSPNHPTPSTLHPSLPLPAAPPRCAASTTASRSAACCRENIRRWGQLCCHTKSARAHTHPRQLHWHTNQHRHAHTHVTSLAP